MEFFLCRQVSYVHFMFLLLRYLLNLTSRRLGKSRSVHVYVTGRRTNDDRVKVQVMSGRITMQRASRTPHSRV